MWKVKCLKDFGYWAKVGEIIELSNGRTEWAEKRGIVKRIKDLGLRGLYSEDRIVYRIEKLARVMESNRVAMEGYKKQLKKLKGGSK